MEANGFRYTIVNDKKRVDLINNNGIGVICYRHVV